MKAIDISINNMTAIAKLANSINTLENTVANIINMNVNDNFEFLKYLNGYSSAITGAVASQNIVGTSNNVTLHDSNSILPFNFQFFDPKNLNTQVTTLNVITPPTGSGQLTIYFFQNQYTLAKNSILSMNCPIINLDSNQLYVTTLPVSDTNGVFLLNASKLVIKIDTLNKFVYNKTPYNMIAFFSKLQ